MSRFRFALVGLLSLVACPASAQANDATNNGGSVLAVPPAPLITPAAPTVITPSTPAPPPPGLVQTPLPPANMDNGSAANDTGADVPPATDGAAPPTGSAANSTSANTVPATPPSLPSTWQQGGTAQLGVLNKIDGGTTQVSIPVGGQAKVGDLRVNVLACESHPADQLPDAAAFVAVQSTQPGAGGPMYRGWMLRSAPGAAVVGDASETFRVISCS